MASNCSCKAVAVLCFFVTALIMHGVTARKFTVGGKTGWLPPASGSATYSDWAERHRFLIGDILVFKYNASEDSVAQVSAEDYNSCSTSNPKCSFKDGNTEFQMPRHGPFYFISGNSTNCHKGEKLTVAVLATRNPGPSPSHASTVVSPPPAPASGVPFPASTSALSPSHETTVASPAPASAVPSLVPVSVIPSTAPTTALSLSPTSTVASPAPATAVPSTAFSPSPSPTVASPAPSYLSVPSMSPVAAPVNTTPLFASPGPAPIASKGGRVPSASARNGNSIVIVEQLIRKLAFHFPVSTPPPPP